MVEEIVGRVVVMVVMGEVGLRRGIGVDLAALLVVMRCCWLVDGVICPLDVSRVCFVGDVVLRILV